MVTSTAAIPRNVVPVTPDGHRLLREQLAALTTRERAEASDRVREAGSDGGHPAENPELMYALQAQQQLERWIDELESQLARARVVENAGANGEVALGTRVRVRRVPSHGRPLEFEIVSSVEADPALGRVSIESPVGEALLGRRPGDLVEVAAPRGLVTFEVLAVEAEPAQHGARDSGDALAVAA